MSRTTPTSTHPQMPPAELDRDEVRILAECERESLLYRSIPLGLATFFATQYAMSRNLITSKGKWFKLSLGLFAGYILGKVSYAPACRRKILKQIPDSNLAHAIRGIEHRQAGDEQRFQERDPTEAVVFVPPPLGESDTQTVPVGVNQYGDPIYQTHK